MEINAKMDIFPKKRFVVHKSFVIGIGTQLFQSSVFCVIQGRISRLLPKK